MILLYKKVFITGAGSGLGKEAAIALARRGHTVYASVHYNNQIDSLLNIASKENLKLESFKLDILNESDRNLILNYDIDVLICNAGIGNSGSVAEVSVDNVEEVFNTNVFCNLRLIQLAIKNMIEVKKQGRIIILSSLVGRISMPFLSPYCASKFSLECFATCLKSEMKILKHIRPDINIEVGIIEPGAYATGFNKENIEKKYVWMDKSSYFSGHFNYIRSNEIKIWNFLEKKSFNSIIKKYIHVVEDKYLKSRYTAPWYQAFFVQLGRILGL